MEKFSDFLEGCLEPEVLDLHCHKKSSLDSSRRTLLTHTHTHTHTHTPQELSSQKKLHLQQKKLSTDHHRQPKQTYSKNTSDIHVYTRVILHAGNPKLQQKRKSVQQLLEEC